MSLSDCGIISKCFDSVTFERFGSISFNVLLLLSTNTHKYEPPYFAMEEDISSIPRFSGSVNLGARMKLSAYTCIIVLDTWYLSAISLYVIRTLCRSKAIALSTAYDWWKFSGPNGLGSEKDFPHSLQI